MAFPGGRLSVGAVSQIFSTPEYNAPVVLQVLEVKKMTPTANKPNAPAGDRFRYVVCPSYMVSHRLMCVL
jgi:hypothetical protein